MKIAPRAHPFPLSFFCLSPFPIFTTTTLIPQRARPPKQSDHHRCQGRLMVFINRRSAPLTPMIAWLEWARAAECDRVSAIAYLDFLEKNWRASVASEKSCRADDLRCVVVSTAALSPAGITKPKLTKGTGVH
jgi:hypothetical protein